MEILEHWKWQEQEKQSENEVRCVSLVTPNGILCRYWGDKDPPEAEDIANAPILKKENAQLKATIKEQDMRIFWLLQNQMGGTTK